MKKIALNIREKVPQKLIKNMTYLRKKNLSKTLLIFLNNIVCSQIYLKQITYHE